MSSYDIDYVRELVRELLRELLELKWWLRIDLIVLIHFTGTVAQGWFIRNIKILYRGNP